MSAADRMPTSVPDGILARHMRHSLRVNPLPNPPQQVNQK